MYLLYLSSQRDDSSGGIGESETSTGCNRVRSIGGQKARIKFHRHMEFFMLKEGHVVIMRQNITLRWKHLVNGWEPKQF